MTAQNYHCNTREILFLIWLRWSCCEQNCARFFIDPRTLPCLVASDRPLTVYLLPTYRLLADGALTTYLTVSVVVALVVVLGQVLLLDVFLLSWLTNW